ncbi:MAG: ferredoxin [bacterium]|nr:ferredoxin [bacterium]
MSTGLRELVRFHLTGDGGGDDRREESGLRSALLAPYRDLSVLRYDFPLVLVERDDDGAIVRSLSSVVDGVLREIAPTGAEGERLRSHYLRLETAMRVLLSEGVEATLSELWGLAERKLLSESDETSAELLRDSLSRPGGAPRVDGEVIDCDDDTPARVFEHAWRAVQQERSRIALAEIDELLLKLSGILEADFQKSAEARDPKSLAGSMGDHVGDSFDFEAMSRVLRTVSSESSLSGSRRERIRSAISVLESQRFFEPAAEPVRDPGRAAAHSFVFDSCTRAWEIFRERIPEMVELVKAIGIAELELDNRYRESEHDALFDRFDETSLAPEDLALFPSYLVRLHDKDCEGSEKARCIEALSSGLPLKILVQMSDILGGPALANGQFTLGARGLQLAGMAVGMNGSFVLQSASSNLYQVRDRILRGLSYEGPALFSIFTGSVENAPGLPPYLEAASAMQSRAFPAFAYDPAAGPDWAARLDVAGNPQAEVDWPVHSFSYEDADLQRVSEEVAFTFIDFAASDKRYARHFAPVPPGDWNESLIPASEYLELADAEALDKVPYVSMVNGDDVLQKLVVDQQLIRAARRCSEMWRALQELGGIHNSHALNLLERERDVWEREKERELEELRERAVPAPASVAIQPADAIPAPAVEPEPEERSADEPYIETPRCTTCDECTELNGRMFAYDENKQAHIVDPSAGTYRELVEAAEACQVCIIHPGKPRNSDEPGLDELIRRAEPFN